MSAQGAGNAQKKRNREAANWILRNRDPNQSPSDKARFQEWLDRDPENRRTYTAAERLLDDASRAIQSDSVLSDIKVRPRSLVKPVIATLMVLALATGSFFALDGPMRLQADVIAGTGEMRTISLEDGSEVQLNSSSAIAVDFTDSHRTIRLLQGQAFFQVAHDVRRPFTVVAGAAKVTALGTAFAIRYGNDNTEVAVNENAVQIDIDGNRTGPVRVSEGEQAIYDYAKGQIAIAPADSLVAFAWRRGQIVLDNTPLSYVIEEMNRHFYGRIMVADSRIANRRVSGTMKITDTDVALAFVTQALHVKAMHFGPLIVIRE